MYQVSLEFKNKQDIGKINSIISEKWKIVKYNDYKAFNDYRNTREHASIEHGMTFLNIEDIVEIAKEMMFFNEPMKCKCNYCSEMKTVGKYVVNMFGFNVSSQKIYRNIYYSNFDQEIVDARIRLMRRFLMIVKELLDKNGIKTSDIIVENEGCTIVFGNQEEIIKMINNEVVNVYGERAKSN